MAAILENVLNEAGSFRITDVETLALARYMQDLDAVTIDTARLKYRKLLPCALKYALWAVRPGGRIVINDEGATDSAPPAFTISTNLVRQWVARFIGRDVEWNGVRNGRIELVRTRPIMRAGWSAGVVFSGADAEIPVLMKCLEGLHAQPELRLENGGEIFVSGPKRDLAFLQSFPNVKYLEFPSPAGDRFLIGRKKNALMSAMIGPRMVILHARVVLEPDTLAGVPREFDMSSPDTTVFVRGQPERYLSLSQTDGVWPGIVTRRTLMMRHFRHSADPLLLHREGGLFVDGGAFYVTKELFEECPLHDHIAWNEGEDVEWCGRAFTHGFLIDLAPKSFAYSQTSKLKPRPRLGPLTEFIWGLSRRKNEMRAALIDRLERLMGRR